jgi:hypothetical protein
VSKTPITCTFSNACALHKFRPCQLQLRELGPAYRGLNPTGTRRWIEIERSSRPFVRTEWRQPVKTTMTYARLETIPVPVLALAGDADLLALMRLLMAHLPGCQFAVVSEADNAAFWEQPKA